MTLSEPVVVYVESKSGETVLNNLEIPADYEILTNLDVHITDTGATVHNISHSDGIMKSRKSDSSDSVAVGNSKKWYQSQSETSKEQSLANQAIQS